MINYKLKCINCSRSLTLMKDESIMYCKKCIAPDEASYHIINFNNDKIIQVSLYIQDIEAYISTNYVDDTTEISFISDDIKNIYFDSAIEFEPENIKQQIKLYMTFS